MSGIRSSQERRLKEAAAETARRQRKREEANMRRLQEDELLAKEALERRKWEQQEKMKFLRKPSARPPPPKKPILVKRGGRKASDVVQPAAGGGGVRERSRSPMAFGTGAPGGAPLSWKDMKETAGEGLHALLGGRPRAPPHAADLWGAEGRPLLGNIESSRRVETSAERLQERIRGLPPAERAAFMSSCEDEGAAPAPGGYRAPPASITMRQPLRAVEVVEVEGLDDFDEGMAAGGGEEAGAGGGGGESSPLRQSIEAWGERPAPTAGRGGTADSIDGTAAHPPASFARDSIDDGGDLVAAPAKQVAKGNKQVGSGIPPSGAPASRPTSNDSYKSSGSAACPMDCDSLDGGSGRWAEAAPAAAHPGWAEEGDGKGKGRAQGSHVALEDALGLKHVKAEDLLHVAEKMKAEDLLHVAEKMKAEDLLHVAEKMKAEDLLHVAEKMKAEDLLHVAEKMKHLTGRMDPHEMMRDATAAHIASAAEVVVARVEVKAAGAGVGMGGKGKGSGGGHVEVVSLSPEPSTWWVDADARAEMGAGGEGKSLQEAAVAARRNPPPAADAVEGAAAGAGAVPCAAGDGDLGFYALERGAALEPSEQPAPAAPAPVAASPPPARARAAAHPPLKWVPEAASKPVRVPRVAGLPAHGEAAGGGYVASLAAHRSPSPGAAARPARARRAPPPPEADAAAEEAEEVGTTQGVEGRRVKEGSYARAMQTAAERAERDTKERQRVERLRHRAEHLRRAKEAAKLEQERREREEAEQLAAMRAAAAAHAQDAARRRLAEAKALERAAKRREAEERRRAQMPAPPEMQAAAAERAAEANRWAAAPGPAHAGAAGGRAAVGPAPGVGASEVHWYVGPAAGRPASDPLAHVHAAAVAPVPARAASARRGRHTPHRTVHFNEPDPRMLSARAYLSNMHAAAGAAPPAAGAHPPPSPGFVARYRDAKGNPTTISTEEAKLLASLHRLDPSAVLRGAPPGLSAVERSQEEVRLKASLLRLDVKLGALSTKTHARALQLGSPSAAGGAAAPPWAAAPEAPPPPPAAWPPAAGHVWPVGHPAAEAAPAGLLQGWPGAEPSPPALPGSHAWPGEEASGSGLPVPAAGKSKGRAIEGRKPSRTTRGVSNSKKKGAREHVGSSGGHIQVFNNIKW